MQEGAFVWYDLATTDPEASGTKILRNPLMST